MLSGADGPIRSLPIPSFSHFYFPQEKTGHGPPSSSLPLEAVAVRETQGHRKQVFCSSTFDIEFATDRHTGGYLSRT